MMKLWYYMQANYQETSTMINKPFLWTQIAWNKRVSIKTNKKYTKVSIQKIELIFTQKTLKKTYKQSKIK